MTEKFPAAALHIGAAVSPFAPHDGLSKALAIVGREKILTVTESLKGFDGKLIDEVLGALTAAWCTAKPITPAINHLKMLGADAVVTALAANLFARTDGGFNPAALNALSPGVRAMAGLPSSGEITPTANSR